MAGHVRVKWDKRAWDSFTRDPGIQRDTDERALRVAVATEALLASSPTNYVFVDNTPTPRTERARTAVIAWDIPARRDAALQALLTALDEGR